MDIDEKLVKAFTELNNAIDADLDSAFKKLSDKYRDLELSHNRKKKCLKRLLRCLCFMDAEFERDSLPMLVNPYAVKDMITDIESVLFCDGREKYRVKGVKDEASKNETE